jgi:NAD-dependent SIR2 family protein deacetylase
MSGQVVVMQTLPERIEILAGWMLESERIVVFTGAGISTDSGLPDFRGPDGVWTRKDKGLPPKDEKKDWSKADPNICHAAIVELQTLGKLDFLVSQNIDNLHLASGIDFDKLAELHGNVARSRCSQCETTYPKDEAPDRCDCVVGFGDQLPVKDIEMSFASARTCDLMIVLGSSLVVTPAANVPLLASEAGARLIIVNQGETPLDFYATLRFEEGIADVFPPAVARLKVLLDNESMAK